MPGRNIVGDYRYNYQGQELDKETGKHAFELRLYDSRINRWLSPDPYGQHASPYMSMGNSWANNVDPDGGMDCPDPPCTGEWYSNHTNELEEVTVTGMALPSLAFKDVPVYKPITGPQGPQKPIGPGTPNVGVLSLLLLANADTSNPLESYPIPDVFDETYLFRRMKVGPDGLPQVGPSSSKLGVRSKKYSPQSQNVDIDLYELHGQERFQFYTRDGRVAGMSTTLDPNGGPGNNPVFRIRITDIFKAGLVPVPDYGDHVTISPGTNGTEYYSYLARLNATRANWTIHGN